MDRIPSHIEIASAAVRVFQNDNTIDMEELSFLLGLAMRDGVLDDDEKRVLEGVFSLIAEKDVSPRVWERICLIRTNYALLGGKPHGGTQ